MPVHFRGVLKGNQVSILTRLTLMTRDCYASSVRVPVASIVSLPVSLPVLCVALIIVRCNNLEPFPIHFSRGSCGSEMLLFKRVKYKQKKLVLSCNTLNSDSNLQPN